MLSEGILVNMLLFSTSRHSDLSRPEKARDGMEFSLLWLISRPQAPEYFRLFDGRNNQICQPTHISQFPHRKLPQSISGQREGEDASVLQLGREVRHGDTRALHGSQVLPRVGAKAVRVEQARLQLPSVEDLWGVGQTREETVENQQQPEPHGEGGEAWLELYQQLGQVGSQSGTKWSSLNKW